MVARASGCNRDRLKLLLADELDEHQQFEVQEHVESCESCRQQLDSMAADPDWWHDTSRLLRIDQLDLDASHASQTLGTNTNTEAARDDGSTCDFVVDYLSPSDNPAMLGRLGEYDILEVVGHGGMGVVLKGYDRELNRYVAVKVLAPHLASSAAARKRFAREAQAAAAVVHQHVVAIHAVDATSTLPYLVMQFVAGGSLQERIDRDGALELRDILRIGMQAAQGLAAAHAQGLVHRDVKPANILIERSVDRVVLSDFGLARAVDDASMTHSAVIAGTPQFMSPEQARGECVDCRSDLFSLGSVLYTMCTGRPPFRSETTLGVLRRITDSHPRPIRETSPEIPAWLCEIIETLLAKAPAERLESAEQVQSLLGRWLAHVQQPGVAPAPPRIWRRSKNANRRRNVAVAAIATAACVVAAAGLFAWSAWGPTSDGDARATSDGKALHEISESMTGTNAVGASGLAVVADESEWLADVNRLNQDILSIEERWSADEATHDQWNQAMSSIRTELERLSVEVRE